MNIHLNAQTNLSDLTHWLQSRNWLPADDRVERLEKPGEGNMNMVLRAVTQRNSLILKQANAFVQKYPSIPAPVERVAVEAAFYRIVSDFPDLQAAMPRFIGFDADNHLLAVEDLGESADYAFIYQKGLVLAANEAVQAADFLARLHRTPFPAEVVANFPDNLALRRLNHEHLFHYPYLTNHGFDLDTVQPGLQAASMPYKTDKTLRGHIEALGERYLQSGAALLHGDFYPGSWLRSANGLRVIDPEFCFFGPAEYDLGVFYAHLKMAQVPEEIQQMALQTYDMTQIDATLAMQFAGMEILRRIIGLAQLPLDLTLAERCDLLDEAAQMVKMGTVDIF